MPTKICSKCGIEKDVKMFYTDSRTKNGYRTSCISCHKLYKKTPEVMERHREQSKRYRGQNKSYFIGVEWQEYLKLFNEHQFSDVKNGRKEYIKEYNKRPEVIRRKELQKPIKFIDLFAGIGGIRLAFERAGGNCVFSSEWDKFAQQTYAKNFGEVPEGDIREIDASTIPDFDVLCAGFPCQPFSIAGVSKKMSLLKPHGFEDKTQGTLFYEILRILKEKQPSAYFLENVKNLEGHDKGKTFSIIKDSLIDAGYSFHYKVINAKALVPQNRERIFMVGFLDQDIEFTFPEIPDHRPKIRDILEENVPEKYTLTEHLWEYLQNYAEKHRLKGNGFGFGLVNKDKHCRTLSARYFKDGSEILIPQEGKNPRRLTPRECARLQGYPDSFEIPVSDTQAYKQFGNSVAVPLIEILAKNLVQTMREMPIKKTEFPVTSKKRPICVS